jgi:hypothetical protein
MAIVYIHEVDQFYEESCRVYDKFICKPRSPDIHVPCATFIELN